MDDSEPGTPNLYRASTAVIRVHEAKRFPGGIIASLSIPWGADKGDDDLGGYHLVWPRDLVEAAGGLLAAGAHQDVPRVLDYLQVTQEADGHWPQNMWLNGSLIGEIGMDAALAGSLGVPTLLVVSCEAGVEEARKLLEKVETFATKKGFSRNCALSLSPLAACDGIRESARRAVEARAGIQPFSVPPPFEVIKEFKYESVADRLGRPFERVGPSKVAVRGEDLFDLI